MTSSGDLYERYAPMVHAILVTMVAPQEAQDLVHDVFVKAYEKIGSLADPERVGPWLAAIARNAGRDALRVAATRRRPAPLPDEDALPAPRGWDAAGGAGGDEEGRVAAEAQAREAREALAALRSLPEAYRETLAMRLVEGLTGPEIARRTGLTPGSVRVNLTRGMKLLRERLGLGREEGP